MTTERDRREEALRQLPIAYSLALRLRDAEVTDAMIAQCLGVEPQALGPLMRVAEAKLAAAYDASQR